MKHRKRHTIIEVPEAWLEAVSEWRHEQKISQEELGRRAAEAIGEPEPFAPSTISRFLSGRCSYQLAQAVALVTGIPLPDVVGLEDQAEQIWLETGQRLHRSAPRWFQEELRDLQDLADIAERRLKRRPKKS